MPTYDRTTLEKKRRERFRREAALKNMRAETLASRREPPRNATSETLMRRFPRLEYLPRAPLPEIPLEQRLAAPMMKPLSSVARAALRGETKPSGATNEMLMRSFGAPMVKPSSAVKTKWSKRPRKKPTRIEGRGIS